MRTDPYGIRTVNSLRGDSYEVFMHLKECEPTLMVFEP